MIFNFIPEIFLAVSVMFSLFLKSFYNKEIKNFIVLLISAAICLFPIYESTNHSCCFFIYKYYDSILKSLLLFSAAIIYKFIYVDFDLFKQNLIILSLIAAMLTLSASDFLSLLFSMEFSIIPIMFLINRKKTFNIYSNKYILYETASVIIFIFAILLMSIFIGSTNFNDIRYALSYHQPKVSYLILIMLFTAFSLKLGAFLAHFGVLDLFKNELQDIAAIFCITRISFIIIFYKIMNIVFYYVDISHILLLTACISLIFGSILIAFQSNIKKITAYFIIYNSGIVFLCSSFQNQESLNSIIYFIISEMISILGIFIIFPNIRKNKNQKIENISDLNGISSWNSSLSISLSILFLSLFGIAPFIGFWSKFSICLSLFYKDIIFPLVIYIVSFAINLICLGKMINAIWFKNPQDGVYFIILNENISRIICFLAFLTIASIPIAHKLVYLMRMEIY